MLEKLQIRESLKDDLAEIESLYPEAFPKENLLSLVRDLLNNAEVAVSFVGTIDTRIAGHAIFTKCGVVGSSVKVGLLGPLAVAPGWQRQGVGSAIVRTGLRHLADEDTDIVCVLGDPAYYRRFGFLPESLVEPPFPLPAEWASAWQSKQLGESLTPRAARLSVPPQWDKPELWAP